MHSKLMHILTTAGASHQLLIQRDVDVALILNFGTHIFGWFEARYFTFW